MQDVHALDRSDSSEDSLAEDETTSFISSPRSTITLVNKSPRNDSFKWKKEADKWQDHSERQQAYYERLMFKLQEKNAKLDALLHSCIKQKTQALATIATKDKEIGELRRSQKSLKYNLEKSDKASASIRGKPTGSPEKSSPHRKLEPIKASTAKSPNEALLAQLRNEKADLQRSLDELRQHADSISKDYAATTDELNASHERESFSSARLKDLENILSQTLLERASMESKLTQELGYIQKRFDALLEALYDIDAFSTSINLCSIADESTAPVDLLTDFTIEGRLMKLLDAMSQVEPLVETLLRDCREYCSKIQGNAIGDEMSRDLEDHKVRLREMEEDLYRLESSLGLVDHRPEGDLAHSGIVDRTLRYLQELEGRIAKASEKKTIERVSILTQTEEDVPINSTTSSTSMQTANEPRKVSCMTQTSDDTISISGIGIPKEHAASLSPPLECIPNTSRASTFTQTMAKLSESPPKTITLNDLSLHPYDDFRSIVLDLQSGLFTIPKLDRSSVDDVDKKCHGVSKRCERLSGGSRGEAFEKVLKEIDEVKDLKVLGERTVCERERKGSVVEVTDGGVKCVNGGE
ncbi:hypothetical protein HDU67_007855 [Dinochytrium kinnereticum]|nr:hypothetical protein HDU67_007855 [Dinochytrium kinnereticum]